LRREPHARSLTLARLGLSETKALLDGIVDDALAARLQHETGGNPFYLVSMLHALRAGEVEGHSPADLSLPDALRDAVRARLAHVPADARPVLDVAAVLGSRFDFALLCAVTGSREEPLLQAVESLTHRRLLIEQ